ncbi:mnmH [Mytilus edulis]|uniref:SelU n=1 Tax=Mytilus edulis TaxID=6550 RepID=A0A8S3U605_MYTED|nr:mnmH [Mytilus edulis]
MSFRRFIGTYTCNNRVFSNRYLQTLTTVKRASKVTVTTDPYHPEATEIIDVRTPDEFKLDHIPKAVNLPVLNNSQRDEVGKLYSTDQFRARKRSRSLATILSEIGFDVFLLEGGYKTYRNRVKEELKILPDKFTYRVITGLTGSGKTHILCKLAENGQQVLDLEGLAKHKGSMLGRYPNEDQPSQKYFTSLLVEKLMSFDPSKTVYMESESRRIGKCSIPEGLFSKLCHAPRICVHLPMEERVKHIIRDYPYMIEDVETLHNILEYLKRYCGTKNVEKWKTLVDQQYWEEFVECLLLHHYDPTYTKSQTKNQLTEDVIDIELCNLSEQSLQSLVDNIITVK